MKTLIIALVGAANFFAAGNIKAENQPKPPEPQAVLLGETLHREGDARNGKTIKVESVIIDHEIGNMANLVVCEVVDGKVIAQHTLCVREGNMIAVPFNTKPAGIGESGIVIMKWWVDEVSGEGITFSLPPAEAPHGGI